jgi:hypothetical protein
MKKMPKHLNSKEDYLNIKNLNLHGWQDEWQRLLDKRFIWVIDKELQSIEDGTTNSFYKVISSTVREMVGESVELNETIHQMVLQEDNNAKIFKIGFTVQEVEDGISGG